MVNYDRFNYKFLDIFNTSYRTFLLKLFTSLIVFNYNKYILLNYVDEFVDNIILLCSSTIFT